MNTEIVFEKARIAGIELKPDSSGRVKIIALATSDIASALGAPWLLDEHALVKQGFASVQLDKTMKDMRAKHTLATASLELVSAVVKKFKVFHRGDNVKKTTRLMVSFSVEYAGGMFELLEHVMKVGSGEGICILSSMQAELFEEPEPEQPAEPMKTKRGTQQTLASAADVEPKRKPKPMTRRTARDAARADHALIDKGQEVYPD